MKKRVSRKVSKRIAEEGDFESLVVSIVQIHQQAQAFAAKAVNVGLTLRNWLIGRQIEVYERHGSDRTAYGDKLMDNLATRLQQQGWARCERRELYRFRHFYLTYPKIVESLTPQSFVLPHLQPPMAYLPGSVPPIRETVSPESQIVETLSPQFEQSVGPACPAGLRGSPRTVCNGFDKARCDVQQIAHTRFAYWRKSFPAERTYFRSHHARRTG